MNHLLKEMHAFLDGQDNRLAAALSDLPTSQIDQFNQYLADQISAFGHAQDSPDIPKPTALAPDAAWTALSWSDPAAVKSQIDQHLGTIRTELQAFFGVFTDSELSAAAAQLEGLSITTLIDGAKSNTHSLMDLLGAQQGATSSLVDEVLASMGQVMDSHSLVTADAPLDGLLQGWQPSLAVASDLLHPADDAMAGMVDVVGMDALQAHDAAALTAHQGSGASEDALLIDQLQSAVMATPVDVAHFSPTYATASTPEQMPLAEGLFNPLSTTASADLLAPSGPLHFGGHV